MNVVAETADLETAEGILSATYAPIQLHPRSPRRGLRLEQSVIGPIQFHHVSLGMDFDAEGAPLEALVFGELTSGQVSQQSDGGDRRYSPGDVFLAARYSDSYTSTVHDADVRLTIIDPTLPSQVADSAPGRAQVPVRFTGYEPVSAQAKSQWKASCAYLREHLLADPEASATALVTASATRLLVATALATFPNNALTEPTPQDRQDSSPATLHRAIAFIDEHSHQDIALADIAADGLGAMNVYCQREYGFAAADERLAATLGSCASVALANGRTYWRAARLADQLQQALATRGVIDQATGILIAQHGCSAEHALHLLNVAAQRNRLTLAEVGAELVMRTSDQERPA